jgi:phenylpropionate dioxygenase-like ring-hydroxylating dioxygenase large terminal subunit
MGELLRRYWQPICLSDELGELPKRVRIMSEDLVAFRDTRGRVGVLDPHCAHRGASLEYGRVEERGIRCCYHGWLYDTDGKCIEMPCEQPGYAEKMDVWQPAYPVHEFGGLVFVFMGAADMKPPFPIYDIVDSTGRDDVVLRGMRLWEDHGIGFVRDCNWLQHYENVMDPYHLLILHGTHSGDQFGSAITADGAPDIAFEATELGVRYRFFRDLPNGNRLERYAECILPNIFLVPNIHEQGSEPKVRSKATELTWCVPADNEHVYGISIVAWPTENGVPLADWKPGTDTLTDTRPGNLRNRPYEIKQRNPDDMEAQEGQRTIAVHALETLALSDRGIAMLRHGLKEAIAAVERGEDPTNVFRGQAANHVVETHAWNTVIEPESQAAE